MRIASKCVPKDWIAGRAAVSEHATAIEGSMLVPGQRGPLFRPGVAMYDLAESGRLIIRPS